MTYKIIRVFRDNTPTAELYTGFTLEQAQAHCQNPNTSGDGWFDAYEEDDMQIEDLEVVLENALDALAYKDEIETLYKKSVNKLKRGVAK